MQHKCLLVCQRAQRCADVSRGWDADLAAAAIAAGAYVLQDISPAHPMAFDSPSHCFEVRGRNSLPQYCLA